MLCPHGEVPGRGEPPRSCDTAPQPVFPIPLQLPEPLMPFRLYNELMGLAKESLQGGETKAKGAKGGPELVDRGADTDKVVVTLVLRLKELLKELPWENMATLRFLLQHLRR